jgi:hypothetical protein
MSQFVHQSKEPQQNGMSPEQWVDGARALQEATEREQARQEAADRPARPQIAQEAVPEPQTPSEAQESDDDDSPLLQSMDEGLASALDRFNNKFRRQKIEAKLAPMNVEDLVMKGELQQEVPISAGVKVIFRTTHGLEYDGMIEELGTVANETSGSELFLRERLANYNLTLSIASIGPKRLTHHLDKDGEFDVDSFRKKFREVMHYPQLLLADMRVNCYWFDERVRTIMVAEELGNG